MLVYCVLMVLDRPTFHALYIGRDRLESWEDKDWYRLLRVAGSLWAWGLTAILFAAHDTRTSRGASGLGRGLLIALAATLAGIGAEIIKTFVRRLRPTDTDGFYAYAWLLDAPWGSINGFPSSHAAVAFGGATMTAWLAPRLAPVVIALAVGCVATRVVSGAHFLTDTYAGGLLGYAVARLFRPAGWWGINGESGPRRPFLP
jgi:membrane-associated phospholipid phosphatase